MRLRALVERARAIAPDLACEIRADAGVDPDIGGIGLDSRVVAPSELFCCVPGSASDGHDHAAEAVAAGASALLVERWLEVEAAQVRVPQVRPAMAWLAVAFHDQPSLRLRMVGITGTNGKTTTAHLVKCILDHHGWPAGLVGTLTGTRTTPEAPHLQATLHAMVESGMKAVAMEVSSHALLQDRVTGTHFDVAVFTNLSPDHLDYHGDMEAYFAAKAKLFRDGMAAAAVVNEADDYGKRLVAELSARGVPTSPYRLGSVADIDVRLDGSSFTWRGQRVDLSLPGLFNIENATAAAEATLLLGVDPPSVAAGLGAATQVAGRFEVVAGPSDDAPTVIVDYSHTPAGIEQVLRSVRRIDPDARLCIVFGAGGDRDRDKRPLMGAAAEAFADDVVLTSDNPRSEDPAEIASAVLSGMNEPGRAVVNLDRRAAITGALRDHGAGDVVVVAGKGHETTQTIGDTVVDFDDRVVARDALADRGGSA